MITPNYILLVVDHGLFVGCLFILYVALWLVYDDSDILMDIWSWQGTIILVKVIDIYFVI